MTFERGRLRCQTQLDGFWCVSALSLSRGVGGGGGWWGKTLPSKNEALSLARVSQASGRHDRFPHLESLKIVVRIVDLDGSKVVNGQSERDQDSSRSAAVECSIDKGYDPTYALARCAGGGEISRRSIR